MHENCFSDFMHCTWAIAVNIYINIRHVTKLSTDLRHLSYGDRLKSSQVLQYCRRRMDMILMLKIMNDDLIDVLFTRSLGSARPHDLKMQMNTYNLRIRKHYFSQRIIKDLPFNNYIVSSPKFNILIFKPRQIRYILEQLAIQILIFIANY